jgi:hypothetical protein
MSSIRNHVVLGDELQILLTISNNSIAGTHALRTKIAVSISKQRRQFGEIFPISANAVVTNVVSP